MRRRHTIVDYVQSYGEYNFWRQSPTIVDGLVLATICYADLEVTPFGKINNFNCTISELGQLVNVGDISRLMWNRVRGERLLSLAADSKRFGDVLMHDYRHDINAGVQKQFTAVTFSLNTDAGYIDVIAFQGTDDTLTGWKEDLNMSFTRHVPAQLAAVDYVEHVANLSDNKLVLVGHSKGGNLAVYAAMKCPRWIKRRIVTVYDYDGPGFLSGTFTALEKIGMAGKVVKVVPSEAFFGLLLNSDPYWQLVVRSDGRSIFQHDPLTWLVDGNHFSLSKDVARTSKLATKSIQRWLGNLSIEQRREFVDSLYDVITQTQQSTLLGLKHYLRLNWATVVKNIKNSDPAVREAISKTLKLLIKSSLIEIRSSISGVFH